jgi:Ca2+-transporting ATPase
MQKSYHTMTVGQVLDKYDSTQQGLSQPNVDARQQQYGKNKLQDAKRTPFVFRFLRQFNDPLIMILVGAAIISTSVAIWEGRTSELLDSSIIVAIVLLNAIIGLVQESKAQTALEALKKMSQPYCNVVRGGVDQRISTTELVQGDIVRLEAGDNVPADIRLIECYNLAVVESALTGESTAVDKQATTLAQEDIPLGDRLNMVYSGSNVINGRALGVVVEVGMGTQVGQIASLISNQTNDKTQLQKQLAKTANIISLGVMVFAVVIFAMAVIHREDIIKSFMTAVAIAVAAIPEGLPVIVTIVFAIGVRKMSAHNSIIKNIPTVEVLGRIQVICSDKTGTLTQNKMTIVELYTHRDNQYKAEVAPQSSAQQLLARAMVYCNDTKRTGAELVGDPTEIALVNYAKRHNLSVLNESVKRVTERPFDSERKLMTVVVQQDGVNTAYTKGATDNLIKLCTHILDGDTIREIAKHDIERVLNINHNMSGRALRVLGVAVSNNTDMLEQGMTFVGLCGMIDPPRPEVAAAVAKCKQASIKPIMITGDHAVTAGAIAKEIGIEGDVYTGQQLDAMSDAELSDCILRCGIFARVSSQNKVRIVNALQAKGLVVAMTGDGVNDAPSIKAADIGIGMGITGTDVSKGAADMVIADDNFATIVGAVEEGRKIFSNIKKAIRFLLSANIAEVAALFIIATLLRQDFLTPIMILLVNLVTDSLPALALGLEKSDSNSMDKPPEPATKNLFAGRMGCQIVVQGIVQTGLVMLCYVVAKYGVNVGSDDYLAMVFVTLVMVQLFQSYNCRAEQNSLFGSNPFGNGFLNIGFLIGTALITSIIFVVPLRGFFRMPEISLLQYILAVGFGLMIIPIVELYKYIERKVLDKR